MKDKKIGFALCGSFCTLDKAIEQMEQLKSEGADIYPIMSNTVYHTDTRFGTAEYFKTKIENICGRSIIHEIAEAEPIGPKAFLDIIIVAPCTGNTLGKIANGITDTSVTMAVKAHLRNLRPVVIAIATNDALSASAKNLGALLNTKYIFFAPFGQDDPLSKSNSMICDFSLIKSAAESALEGKQFQPILL